MRRVSLLLAGLAATALLTACGSDDPPAAAGGLDTRTVEAGEVTVTITPTRFDRTGAVFAIALDTHTVELDLDVSDGAELTVEGVTWPDAAWEGDGAGGHHREGDLTFAAAGDAAGEATLTIDGLPEPVRATWTLPEGS